MKYQVYKLVGKEKILADGYETKRKTFYKLTLADEYGYESYPSYESAMESIKENRENLKGETLTILPIINIDWDGEIYS